MNLRDEYGDIKIWVVIVSSALAMGAFAGVSMTMGNAVSREMEKSNCAKWGATTNRPVKFVSFNWWSYDCFTKDGDTWIPKDKIRSVG